MPQYGCFLIFLQIYLATVLVSQFSETISNWISHGRADLVIAFLSAGHDYGWLLQWCCVCWSANSHRVCNDLFHNGCEYRIGSDETRPGYCVPHAFQDSFVFGSL